MNSFDVTVLHFLNGFARRSPMLDHTMSFLTWAPFTIGAVPMAFFWYAWIQCGSADAEKRKILALGIFDSVFALFVARVLAFSLPFRVRPFFNSALHFQVPIGVTPSIYIGWSSFPSDRTTLFFCVAAILWMVSRRLGILAFCYTFFVACLPAMYVGMHYPTDIIAGALLGIGIAGLCRSSRLTAHVGSFVLRWANKKPALFQAALFLWTYEIAELFHSVRDIVLHILRYARLMN